MKFLRSAAWILLLAIGVAAANQLVRFARTASRNETFCFSANYTAARLILRGAAKGSLQDWDWFRDQTRRYGFRQTDIFFGNLPSAALVMVPLAKLPPARARVIWTWLTLLFWAAGVGALGAAMVRSAQGSLIMAAPALLCLAALFDPLRANIDVAHIYPLLFLLQSLCCWAWLARRPAAAGGLAGMMLALKGYGLPLIALAVLRRDWRFVRASAGGFTVLAVFAGFRLGFRQWADFAVAQANPAFSGIGTPALQTLKSFLILALGLPTAENGPTLTPAADHLLMLLLAIVVAGVLIWLAEPRLFRAPSSESNSQTPTPAVLAACVLLGLAFSPMAENHSYPLAMTALLLMIPELRRLTLPAAGVILGGILLSFPFQLQDRTPMHSWHLAEDYARLWGAVLVLLSALAVEYRRRRGREAFGGAWTGAYLACAMGVVLPLWYVQPWRDPMRSGPLLAVSQTQQNRIALIQLDPDEREVATIPVSCKGPFGIAFDSSRRWLYAACTDSSQVCLLDLYARRLQNCFPGSSYPAWAQHRDGSEEMWITNEMAASVTVYRAGTSTLLAEFPTGLGPSDIAFTDHGRRAWVSNEASGTVSWVDAERRQKLRDIPVGKIPQGIALTQKADRLLVANFGSDTLSVLDTAEAKESFQISVCGGPLDVTTAVAGGTDLAYVSCFKEGAVGVVDLNRREMIQRIAVGDRPQGMTTHPDGTRVYVCVGGPDRILTLETGRLSRVVRRLVLDGTPLQIAVAP